MWALTLHQPWATLMALGVQRFETRDWRPWARPPFALAIHAGKAETDDGLALHDWITGDHMDPEATCGLQVAAALEPYRRACPRWSDLPRGAVVAVCRCVWVHRAEALVRPEIYAEPTQRERVGIGAAEEMCGDYPPGGSPGKRSTSAHCASRSQPAASPRCGGGPHRTISNLSCLRRRDRAASSVAHALRDAPRDEPGCAGWPVP